MGNVKLLETKTKDELNIAIGCRGVNLLITEKITIMMISLFILIAMLVKKKRNGIVKYMCDVNVLLNAY